MTQVMYSSVVRWRSPLGEDIEFSESSTVSVHPSTNTVQISPLTPGTAYTFNVFASSDNGQGQKASIVENTAGGATDQSNVFIGNTYPYHMPSV